MVDISGRLSAEGNLSGVASTDASLAGTLAGGALLSGRLSPAPKLRGVVSVTETLTGGLSISTGSIPAYHGETTITPSTEEQVISCGGLAMPTDIVVEAIPSNYGLITWDGVTLSVS